jgi:hypothetical protein
MATRPLLLRAVYIVINYIRSGMPDCGRSALYMMNAAALDAGPTYAMPAVT